VSVRIRHGVTRATFPRRIQKVRADDDDAMYKVVLTQNDIILLFATYIHRVTVT